MDDYARDVAEWATYVQAWMAGYKAAGGDPSAAHAQAAEAFEEWQRASLTPAARRDTPPGP